jgi:hypothetical protein
MRISANQLVFILVAQQISKQTQPAQLCRSKTKLQGQGAIFKIILLLFLRYYCLGFDDTEVALLNAGAERPDFLKSLDEVCIGPPPFFENLNTRFADVTLGEDGAIPAREFLEASGDIPCFLDPLVWPSGWSNQM